MIIAFSMGYNDRYKVLYSVLYNTPIWAQL